MCRKRQQRLPGVGFELQLHVEKDKDRVIAHCGTQIEGEGTDTHMFTLQGVEVFF